MSKILDIFIDWSWAILCAVWAIECIFLWRTSLRKKLFGKKNARVLLTELKTYREDYLSRPVDLDKEVYLGRPGLVFWPSVTLTIIMAILEAPEEGEV